MEQRIFQKLTVSQLVTQSLTLNGTRKFATVFTKARYMSLSRVRSSPLPNSISWSVLTWSSHQNLSLPNGLFPSGFRTKTLYARLLPSTPICATCPPISFYLICSPEYLVKSTIYEIQHYKILPKGVTCKPLGIFAVAGRYESILHVQNSACVEILLLRITVIIHSLVFNLEGRAWQEP